VHSAGVFEGSWCSTAGVGLLLLGGTKVVSAQEAVRSRVAPRGASARMPAAPPLVVGLRPNATQGAFSANVVDPSPLSTDRLPRYISPLGLTGARRKLGASHYTRKRLPLSHGGHGASLVPPYTRGSVSLWHGVSNASLVPPYKLGIVSHTRPRGTAGASVHTKPIHICDQSLTNIYAPSIVVRRLGCRPD